MNKETLDKHLADLESSLTFLQQQIGQLSQTLQQRQADAIATNGAIQECKYWLDQLAVKKEE